MMIMMRFFTAGLILAMVAGLAVAQDAKKRQYDNLPYEELQKLLDGAKAKGDWSNMADIARTMISKQSDNPEPHYWLASALLKNGKSDYALGEFAEAISLDPNYLEAYLGRAIAYTDKEMPALARDEILLAAERCLSAIREIQTSQIPEIVRLKDYLKSPSFFMEAIEKEVPSPPHTEDRFLCPLRKPEGPPPPPTQGILSEAEQRQKREEMKQLYQKVENEVSQGENDAAREDFRALKALYEDYVLTGKISTDGIRIEMENLWKQAKRAFHPPILRAELEKLTKEANKGLANLDSALKNKNLNEAEEINKGLESSLKEIITNTEPEFEPLQKLAEQYNQKRQEIYKRAVVLREFREKISLHIYLRMIITGRDVESIAFLETDFDRKSGMYTLRENEPLPLPEETLASLTLTKIEDDKIIVNYKKDGVEVADEMTFPKHVEEASESDSKAP